MLQAAINPSGRCRCAVSVAAAFVLFGSTVQSATIDFEDLALPGANQFAAQSFTSGGAQFNGELIFDAYWRGYAFSNSTLNQNLSISPGSIITTQPIHQFTAYTPGSVDPNNTYAVANFFESMVLPGLGRTDRFAPIVLPAGQTIQSIDVTNSTWAAHSMLIGDGFNAPFGPNDQLRLYVFGEQNGVDVGSVEFVLGAGSNVVDDWTTIDLSSLYGADTLRFALSSTDTSIFSGFEFINAPTYFAIDNIVTVSLAASVPEPNSCLGMLVCGLAAAASYRLVRRKRP